MGDTPAKPEDGGAHTQKPNAASEPPKPPPVAILAYGHAYVLAEQAAKKEPEEKFFHLRADGWVAVFTLILTLATGALWWVTKTAISDARKASERELRAYVMVTLKGLRMRPLPRPRKPDAEAGIEIFNRGKTPAGDIGVSWAVAICPPKISREEVDNILSRASNSEDSKVLLGPGESRGAHIVIDQFSTEEIESVRKEEAFAYVIGLVEYLDAFGVTRRTRFCHRYHGGDLGPDGGSYGHYGNSYT